jgi:hypothetical protein
MAFFFVLVLVLDQHALDVASARGRAEARPYR